MTVSSLVTSVIILVGVVLGLIFTCVSAVAVAKIKVTPTGSTRANSKLINTDVDADIYRVSQAISRGANAFLIKEYQYLVIFVIAFSVILMATLAPLTKDVARAGFTVIAFVAGSITSILAGWVGMKIAVFANSRTAIACRDGWTPGFNLAFRAGCVMGFSLVCLGIFVLWVLMCFFSLHWSNRATDQNEAKAMFEAIAGYGLGGSSIALFGRVGGGIYTKAADVGADLVGKVENSMEEDDPRNPAVIADNVGDNVGDIAGMGADLFGSFAESSCAVMVISSQSADLHSSWASMSFPLVLASCGVVVCILTSFVATNIMPVKSEKDVEATLKRQLTVSTSLMTPVAFVVCLLFLPSEFSVEGKDHVKYWHAFLCIACGLWSGLIIGYITEYYTSNSNRPVQEVAESASTGGAATVIIYGLALGYQSVIIPVFCIAITIFVSYSLASMFGIAIAAVGILSTMSIGLTIDAYGPICDNAGGIAEMAKMDEDVNEKCDSLDAAGNTTAAIGKGFAIGSAALVSLALFGAFVTTAEGLGTVNILRPFVFAGLLVGAMLPYWFSAMTMKSVGFAAEIMVEEVRRQFREYPGILDGTEEPHYDECVAISTDASLREMIAPGALVMLTPLIVGFLFGTECLAGVLVGALISGVQVALSASNTGGAWDNAKKYVEKGHLGEGKGKNSDEHVATIIGDTVGDPLKDTSGPALNILIKLSAIISLVFAPAFFSVEKGGLLEQLVNKF